MYNRDMSSLMLRLAIHIGVAIHTETEREREIRNNCLSQSVAYVTRMRVSEMKVLSLTFDMSSLTL